MRRSRLLFCLGLFVGFLSLPSSLQSRVFAADVATDSVVVVDHASAPDPTLTIHLLKGPSIEAEYVGYWRMDSFRYRTGSGETGYLLANKIRSIEDAEGKDRFERMRRERSSFGRFDTIPRGPRSYTAWITGPFRQTPERRRRSYCVVELGAGNRASGAPRGSGHLFLTGIGGIRNLSPAWGLGGIVQFTSASDDEQTIAFGVRLRRYLSDQFAVETTQGIYQRLGENQPSEGGVPYFGEVAMSAGGAVSLFGRVERHEFTRWRWSSYPYVAEKVEISESSVHVGVRLGPRPGYLSVPATIIGSLGVLAQSGLQGRDY
ncbi:MAG TPA: hypothetical protein VFU59_01345 [Candidatus Eisenbacteria bacterium]|nr:hypothetical protein [Candidatus Eisenbacteria bacterium]